MRPVIVYGAAPDVSSRPLRTVRVQPWEQDGKVNVGIGEGNPQRRARAAACLTPDGARDLATALTTAANAVERREQSSARPSWPPCDYERHRPFDWRGDAGRLICGICHPPADPSWATRGGES